MENELPIGTVLADRYRVLQLVGVGAMGAVYRAEHVHMRKTVALKILHSQLTKIPDMVQRFEQEAQAAAQIQHPHVAAATDFGKLADGRVYLALEFIEGIALSELIKQGPLSPRRVLNIGHQVASALEAAHAKGIVHRDLKPDNLLIISGQKDDFIKILDFGIAKLPAQPQADDKPLTMAGMVYGTPEYMAPEQALAQVVDGRADIYAFGVVLYEMLTGRRPYLGPSNGILGQQLSVPLPKMNEVAPVKVPSALQQMVVEMLATDPTNRQANVTVVRMEIENLEAAWDEGRIGEQQQRASGLLSVSFEEVTNRFEQVAQKIPEPIKVAVVSRTSRATLLSLLFGGLGVVGAIYAVGALRSAPVAPQSIVIETPPPVVEEREQPPALDAELTRAKTEGLDSLIKLSQKKPTEGMVQAELSLELARAKKYEAALTAARTALELDPKLNDHPKIAGALFRAAQSSTVAAATLRLLQGPMGPAGVSIIYDLAHTPGVSGRVRADAQRLLAEDSVRDAAPPAVALVLALQAAQTCAEFAPLVERALLVGDRRALPILESLSSATGCGAKKQDDCYPCLRHSVSLADAITTINQRVTLGGGTSER